MTALIDKTQPSATFPSTIRGGDFFSEFAQPSTYRSFAGTVPSESPAAPPSRQARATPKRRLRGFVIAFSGQEVRVGFVQADDSIIEYLLPAASLKKAGITEENQPFEMDEIEETTDGEYSLTYRYRSMAPAASAATDILESGERDGIAEKGNLLS